MGTNEGGQIAPAGGDWGSWPSRGGTTSTATTDHTTTTIILSRVAQSFLFSFCSPPSSTLHLPILHTISLPWKISLVPSSCYRFSTRRVRES